MRVIIIPRSRLCLLLGALFLAILLLWVFFFYNTRDIEGGIRELKIFVDAGHGGVDGGTSDSRGNLEKNINLRLALLLNEQLVQSGLNVVLARKTDIALAPFNILKYGRHRRDLTTRIQRAKAEKCLFLISIHCDWSRNSQKRGAMVFYHYGSGLSKQLAGLIQEELNEVQERPRIIAPGRYFILSQPGINGVLVEAGYLSNQEEAMLLQEQNYLEKLAMAIARGILRYCRNYLPADPPAFNNQFDLEKMKL